MKHLFALCVLACATFAALAQPLQQWTQTYTIDTTAYEGTNDMVTDANGNIYQLIQTQVYLQNSTLFKPVIRKVASNGTVVWSYIYTHGGSNDVTFNNIGIDDSGNVYLAGYRLTTGQNGTYFWHAIKLDNDGNYQWQHELSDLAVENRANKLIVHNNAIYIAGYTYNAGDGIKTLLVKLDATGSETWKRYMDCTTSWDSSPLLIMPSGNILTGCNDSIVILQPDGSHYAAADTSLGIYNNVSFAVDANNNTYTFHWQSYDYVVRKFDANANLLWTRDSIGNYLAFGDWQIPMVTDGNGNVYVGSIIDSQSGMDSVYLYKLNTSGAVVWKKLLDYDPASLVYRNNKLYAAGASMYSGQSAILQIDPVTANVDWTVSQGDSVQQSQTDKLLIDNSGAFVYASRTVGMGYWDAVLSRYTGNTTGISEVEGLSFSLYPNPANGYVVVAVNINNATLSIHDIQGRLVAEHELSATANLIDITNLNSGMYLTKVGGTVKRFVKE